MARKTKKPVTLLKLIDSMKKPGFFAPAIQHKRELFTFSDIFQGLFSAHY